MSNNSVIEFEDSENTGEVTALQVDALETILIGDANASAVTITPNTTAAGTLTSTGMLTATVGITTTDVGLILSHAAALDQSDNNLVELTENSDSVQFGFGGTDLDIVWSDGALNLRNAEDSVNAIVEIEGKDAGERGELRVLSDGDDKYGAIYHDDTDTLVYSSSGDIELAADADTDDYVTISTATNVTSISVPGSTGTIGTAAAEWDEAFFNDESVIKFGDDQDTTLTHDPDTGLVLNNKLTAVDATFTGTTTVSTLTQAATASPTWTASDSSTTADGTFDIKVDAATAKYGGLLRLYVDEGDGAGADGAEDVLFMTINGSGTNSTKSGTIEFERIGNFEMGLSSSNGTTGAGFIDLYEDEDEAGSNYTRIQAPVLASTYTLTLPTTDGGANEILKTDGNGVLSWTSAGSATAWDDIEDPDNNGTKTITFDNAAEATVLSNAYDTAGSFLTIDNTDDDHANNTYLLDLDYSADDNDVDADYIKAQDQGGTVFTLQQNGDIATTGTIVTTSNSITLGDTSAGDPVITFDSGNDGTITWEEDGSDFEIAGDVEVAGRVSALLATEQLRLSYDATNYLTAVLLDDGHTTFTTVDPDGAEADINLNPDGNVGIKTAAPSVALDVTGSILASVNVAGATYGSDSSISDAELLTLDDGATTEILVGGGAGSAPVWTTAQGSGAPVRATSPTLTTPNIGAATGTSLDVSGDVAGATVTIDNGGTITFTDGASDTIAHTNDTGIAMVSESGTVTVESVVFTGGALTGVTASDGLTIGDGGSSNYTTISDTGAISQAGTATLTVQDGSDFIVTANANAGPYLANDGDTGTGTFDFGGATALEIPNGTTNPASTTGSIALDTDGDGSEFDGPVLAVSTNGATMGYVFTTTGFPGTSEDNYVMKYDAGADTVSWEADSTGSALGSNLTSSTNDIVSDNNSIELESNSEDLDFEFTSNVITLTTDTGVAELDVSGLTLLTAAAVAGTTGTFSTSVVTNLIDTTGAADIDIGSIDVTDVTILTDGGADSLTIGGGTALDFGITFDASNADGTIVWDEDPGVFEFDTAILAPINQQTKTGAYTVGTDNASEAYGTMFINTGAPTYTLPSAVAGMSMCFMQGQGRTDIITVTPAASDYLVVEGARGTAATAYASAGAADEKICIVAANADDWYVTSEVGTWAE